MEMLHPEVVDCSRVTTMYRIILIELSPENRVYPVLKLWEWGKTNKAKKCYKRRIVKIW